ncbi:hypothetical protein [Clostridium cellulovorans]|uniref:Uncharacterized protein n=1 Tax=Clostridium cellulovorans (strain ATCC 35296 / DSM 3052 / OCM 3 / 743B) TaxID=573061 RepID=D9SUF0_CLOC7|nr:hypothetical protein [Clostridium cellulovorans]ADL52905.1 hypothetical protein Clocel_3219 [Clostridium cellulovorans 743B]
MSSLSGDRMEYEEIIGEDLKKRTISYLKLYNSEDYLKGLISYLKKRGYGYIVNEIEKVVENNKENSVEEILKLLIDVDLIDKPRININNGFEKKSRILYKQAKGLELRREIIITSYNYPLKIIHIAAKNEEIVKGSCSENTVTVDIVIPSGVEKIYNVTEEIIIITNYNTEKVHFTIEAEKENHRNTKVIQGENSNSETITNSWQDTEGEDTVQVTAYITAPTEKSSLKDKEKQESSKTAKKKKSKGRKKKNTPINSVRKTLEKILFKSKKRK